VKPSMGNNSQTVSMQSSSEVLYIHTDRNYISSQTSDELIRRIFSTYIPI
jgi:hypothetical protein